MGKDDVFGMSNETRAELAGNAVARFMQDTGLENEDMETGITDLLADILHLCDKEGIDIDRCKRMASYHYTEEVTEHKRIENKGRRRTNAIKSKSHDKHHAVS
jgi:hypothetical protein